jgi:hypothetical protein
MRQWFFMNSGDETSMVFLNYIFAKPPQVKIALHLQSRNIRLQGASISWRVQPSCEVITSSKLSDINAIDIFRHSSHPHFIRSWEFSVFPGQFQIEISEVGGTQC